MKGAFATASFILNKGWLLGEQREIESKFDSENCGWDWGVPISKDGNILCLKVGVPCGGENLVESGKLLLP